jgi:tRNA threonylcarbamoyladenosine biosynthesis protein TsaE
MYCKDLNQLEEIVTTFANKVKAGQTIGLIGQLGAGKTTFTQFLLKALGYTDLVNSPSYALENRYDLPNGIEIIHQDLYRLNYLEPEFLEDITNNQIRIVEWIDKFPELEVCADYVIKLNICDNGREIVITNNSVY